MSIVSDDVYKFIVLSISRYSLYL